MASLNINGYEINVKWFEAILPLWNEHGNVRPIPRNVYDFSTAFIWLTLAFVTLPFFWLFSHIPFIWPEMLGGFVVCLCVCIGVTPYQDYFRAVFVLALTGVLLYYHVQFDLCIFWMHVERYIYYLVITACLITLIRRWYNALCWWQIDTICKKYGIPIYDQKTLMDAYAGYDTHYGEKKKLSYDSYQEALAAEYANRIKKR